MAKGWTSVVKSAVLVALTGLLVSTGYAQVTNVDGKQATPIPGVGHDYIHGLQETVNPAGGSVSTRFDFGTPESRGFSEPVALMYSSSGVHQVAASYQTVANGWYSDPYLGWSFSLPTLTAVMNQYEWVGGAGGQDGNPTPYGCTVATNYVFQDPSGARHMLPISMAYTADTLGNQACDSTELGGGPYNPQFFNFHTVLSGRDDYYTATTVQGINPEAPVTVTDNDGKVYYFSGSPFYSCGSGSGCTGAAPNSIEDRNGNIMTGYTDTADRTAVSFSKNGSPASPASATQVNIAGLTSPFYLQRDTQNTNISFGYQYLENYPNSFCSIGAAGQSGTGPVAVVRTLTLPNGQAYHFEYDATYGLLTKIIYPTGGYVQYVWGENPLSAISYGVGAYPSSPNPQTFSCTLRHGTAAVMHRYVSYDGVNIAEQQDFNYAPTVWDGSSPNWISKTTTVTTKDLIRNLQYDTVYNYAPVFLPNPPSTPLSSPVYTNSQTEVESSIVYKNFDGSVLKTVNKGWIDQFLMGCETKTEANGQTTGTWYQYNGHAQETNKKEYDYGTFSTTCSNATATTPPSVTPTRETVTAYQTFNTTPSGGTIYNRPSSVQTFANGALAAETDYFYDETATTSVAAVQHDDQNYPAGTGISRGNLTRSVHKCFIPSTGATCHDAVITDTYDETGQLRSTTDAVGNATGDAAHHTTTYSYADNFTEGGPAPGNTNAYLTTITYPTTSANGISHTESYAYAYQDGQLKSATDENQQTTSYDYSDPLRRLKSITGPADPISGQHPQTIHNYTDSSTPYASMTEVQTNIDGRYTDSLIVFDGLGRPARTATLNDEGDGNNPYDQVDTCFDGFDQKYYSTNPYRSSGFNAPYTCNNSQRPGDTFTYDALGRVTAVTHPDGTTVSTDYSQFPTVTITDEAGNPRRNRSDALGRLLEVDEPGGLPATTAGGSLAINGTLQNFSSGPLPAASGHIELTFSGTLQGGSCTDACSAPDSGSISITVAGLTKSANYSSSTGTDSGQTVQALANAFNSDSTSPVKAIYYGADESGNIVIDLIAKATGAATNYPITTSIVSNVYPTPSFQVSAGSHLIGGQDASGPATSGHATLSFSGTILSKTSCSGSGGQPCSDSGSISATVTTSVGPYSKSAVYNSTTSNNGSQAVQALANAFHNDANSPVDAFFTSDEFGNPIMNLTARAVGATTNYALSASVVSNDPGDFPSPSFQVSVPSALAGGQNATNAGTIADSGTVYLSVGAFNISVPFGQGSNSTSAMVASALGSGLNVSSSPVTTTVSGSTIALTYKTAGAAGNVGANLSTSSFAPDTPSFYSPDATLTGGANAQPLLLSTPAVTLYSYDGLDNLVCVEQHGIVSGTGCNSQASSDASSPWRVRRFAYDSLSRLLTATNPETGPISYAYDANSNVVSKTSPAPNQTGNSTVTINYSYDELNRLLSRSSTGQPTESYTYDVSSVMGTNVHNPIGRLVETTSSSSAGNVVTIDSYDLMGRIEFETEYPNRGNSSLFKTFSYTYNLDGSLHTITYPSTRQVTYQYNRAQRPTSASDSNGINFGTSAHYTAWGAMSSEIIGNTSSFTGITVTDNYNTRMQPVFLSAASQSQTVLSLGYDFTSCNGNGGNNGNVCRLVNNKDSSRTQSFAYDGVNRLTSATSTNWGQSFGYDMWGNLLQKAATGGDTPLNINVNGKNQATNWCYDAAGNVLGSLNCARYITSGTPYPNHYDVDNRLASFGNASFDYDADGQRVKKIGNPSTLYWYGPGGEVLEETDLSGNLTNEYVFFGGKRVARYNTTNGYSYYFADHLGSADVVTDALGNIKEESDYYPFGGERVVTDLGLDNRYKFTGKERDPETGCDYFGARYYCNPIGRFITPDWAAKPTDIPYANFGNPQSLNLYSYVQNNPTTLGDPDGHCGVITCPLVVTVGRIAVGTVSTVAAVDSAMMAVTTWALTRPTTPSNLSGGNMGTIGMSEQMLDAQVQSQQSQAIQNANNGSSQGGQQQGTAEQGSGQQSTPADPNKRPGTLGKADHQETVKQEAERINGKTEVKIETPQGSKGSRRADAVGTNQETGAPEIVQVYRPTKGGNVPAREVSAANDIQNATGVKPTMVPVRPLPEPKK